MGPANTTPGSVSALSGWTPQVSPLNSPAPTPHSPIGASTGRRATAASMAIRSAAVSGYGRLAV